MLDQKKLTAIELLIRGDMSKTDIAEKVGIHRTTLYGWLDDEEFKKAFNDTLQKIKLYGENTIKAHLEKSVNNIFVLANTSESEKIRFEANQYLIDRVLGKTTSKQELEIIDNTSSSKDKDEFTKLLDGEEIK
jgi:transposase-like protein